MLCSVVVGQKLFHRTLIRRYFAITEIRMLLKHVSVTIAGLTHVIAISLIHFHKSILLPILCDATAIEMSKEC